VVRPSQLADAQCAAGRGSALALRCLGWDGERTDYSYAKLAEAATNCASFLKQMGLRSGETVGVMIGRKAETVIAALGIWKAGGVYCPLFTDLGPDPALVRMELVSVRILIVEAEIYQSLIAPLRMFLADLRQVLVVGGDGFISGCLDFRSGLHAAPPLPAIEPAPEGQAVIVHFTSGTTAPVAGGGAPPKAVMHDALVMDEIAASARFAFALKPGEMMWCSAEPGWVTHTAYGLIAPLALGGTILIDEVSPTPTRCLSVLEDEPVAVWYTTPTLIRGMMGGGAAPAKAFKPKALRLAACVGEPLSKDAVEWGRSVLGAAFRDTWWQTETGAIVLGHEPSLPPVPGSMGRPRPGLQVSLVHRREDGIEVLDNLPGTGELAIRNEDLPPWRSLGGEGGALPEELEGWHLSGDFVRRDADGYYWFLGREDEVVMAGGRMIGPFEVESALMSHPAVAEAGVVGAPDWRMHEHLVAFVGVNPGFEAGEPLRRELLDYARSHLGESLCPQELFFETDMPRTPSGKIIRRALKTRLQPSVLSGE